MPLSLKKKGAVGIDLGHQWIRVAEIDRSGSGWTVSRVAKAPMPEGAMRDGVVTDTEAAGAALRQLLTQTGMHPSTAHMAVAGGAVVVRSVRIPKMAESALRRSIKIEAGRYVPSSVEDSYIEFEIIGPADETQMDVLIVAAPREVVETRMEAAKKAGLDVESVDIEVFAAYRSLVEADETTGWHDKTVALIDIGAYHTNVSVVQKGVFMMTRTIPQGGSVLTQALMNYFKLSPEEAEEGKAQLDVALLGDDTSPRENPPLRVIQPHLDDLIREIRRSLNYFQSQQSEGQKIDVEALLVSGGGSKLHGLAEYIAHKLTIPTYCAGVFENPRFTYGGTDEVGGGQEWAVATGLAMRSHVRMEKRAA
jgi:type IV pilus assembly protein PilM